jgi:regulator of sigma E protease
MEWLSSLGIVGSILRVLILLLEVVVVFNLLILVHEWGHFLAARWRGLVIEKFYIWFGKPIWKKTINGVEYGLGSLPFGGFVALPQMAPMDAIEGKVDDRERLPPISALDKIIVAFAGPLFSFLLACLFAVVVMFVGMPKRVSQTTTIGWVKPGSPAEVAGLKVGDKILEIDGTRITSWDAPIDSVRERIPFSQGPTIKFKVERAGEAKPIVIESGFAVEPGDWLQRTGLRTVGLESAHNFKVGDVKPNSPADIAGIKKDDLITHLNGKEILTYRAISEFFRETPDAKANVVIKRGTESKEVELVARRPDKPVGFTKALSGLTFESTEIQDESLVYPNWWQSVRNSSLMMFRTIKGLVTPGDNVGFEHLSGPVKIFSIYYNLFQEENGWRTVLWFSVVLNVNLALLNLIPFPVLDGGHIVMGFAEMIRRRPIFHMKWLEIFQTACALTLFGFILFVTWFDSWDLLGNGKEKDPFANTKYEDIQFNAPAAK